MKEVILSADGESILYSVPDTVADNLEEYCLEFCGKWLHSSPYAEQYRTESGFCFTEADFIDYLNRYVFQRERSEPVKNLGWVESVDELPEYYKSLPYFNF